MPSTLFQKLFFALIFAVTIFAFVQMWHDHKENVRKGICMERTIQLCAAMSGAGGDAVTNDAIIVPFDSATIAEARVRIAGFGPRAGYFNFSGHDSAGVTIEEIIMTPPIDQAKGTAPTALDAVKVVWRRAPAYSAWRATITTLSIRRDSLIF